METATDKLTFDELLEAAMAGSKFKPRSKDEDRQAFLSRLVERIAEVPQEQFDNLSDPAQSWYNNAVDLLNADKPLEPPEGYGEADGGAEASTGTGKRASGKKAAAPKKAPASKKTAAPKKAPASKKTAAPKEPKEKLVGLARVRPREGESVGRVIRLALVRDQALTADDLRDRLKKAGFKDVPKSTISTMTADIMRTLYVAAQAGLFKPNPPMPKGSLVAAD
jgi:hypothetical protein